MPAMYKGDFFTIAFNKDKLQIVHIDSTALKQVRTLVTVNLPKELIIDYKVANKDALADFIKKSLHEVKIDQKSVALVIPEFSAYTKQVQLPSIPDSEVAEAIKWQIKDYLPSAAQDMIVDSRIINKKGNKVDHLVVAVEKNLLYSYVDSVVLAGLTPVAIETQALSLARLAKDKGKATLVIYKNFGEVILVVTNGITIYGSSVVAVDDEKSVLGTVERMLKHYHKQFKPERIMVAGKGFGQNFYNSVKSYTNIAPEGVLARVEGVSDAEYNDFLIPISTQTTEPFEPISTSTVNLLPPVFSQNRKSRKTWQRMGLLLTFMAVILSLCLIASVVVYNIVKTNTGISAVNSEISQSQEADEVVARVNDVNNLSKQINATEELEISPPTLINIFRKARPNGIQYSEYSLNLDQGEIKLSGVSSTRQDLINLRNNLNESGEFEVLVLPITSLEQVNDINFEINLKYIKAVENSVPKIKL